MRQGKQKDKEYSRSKAIRDIIRERAQDETFKGSQAILIAAVQETMRSEHRREEDRFLALYARIAYQMAWTLILLVRFVSFVLKGKAGALIEESETAARANVTRRTPQIEEVIGKFRASIKE